MLRAYKALGVLVFGVLLACSALAAYDALAARGVTRLKSEIRELRDTLAVQKTNLALADQAADLAHRYVVALNDTIDRQRDSLRKVTTWADTVRAAAAPKRRAAKVVRGTDVDTLFLAAVPYVVPRPVALHVELLEGVIVADSIERRSILERVALLERGRDSSARLDLSRLAQIAERDGSITTREAIMATQDSLIAAKTSRCGRKCGMAIGAGATAAAVWVATKVVQALGGARE